MPLLTREGEVAIARRIERGERRILRALLKSPIAVEEPAQRSRRRAQLKTSPEARRAAIAKVATLAGGLVRAEAALRDCEHRAGMPAAQLDRLLGQVRRSPAKERQVARELGLTRSELEAFARGIERSRKSIAVIEHTGRSSAAAQRAVHRELTEAARTVDEARAEMVRANVRLVASVAKSYLNRGVSYFDLIQEGTIGLLKGIEKFDYHRGFKLCTYASWWIRVAMSRAVADQTRTIRVPQNVMSQMRRVARASRELGFALGRPATVDEIARRLDLSAEKVHHLLDVVKEPISFEAPIGPGEGMSLGELLEDRGAASPADALFSSDLVDHTRSALSALTDREAKILRLRFGIDGRGEHTLEEISHVFGLTRERIRQIEAAAFAKLRRRRAAELHSLIED